MNLQDIILNWFSTNSNIAIFISLILNIIISLLAFLPSVFITGANLIFFGFWKGTIISFLGEVLGAMISFWIYKKGISKIDLSKLSKFKRVSHLRETTGKDSFYLILTLRVLPFIPSGIVTLAAALSKTSFFIFTAATVLGKAPALLLEAFSVFQITEFNTVGKLLLLLISLYLGITFIKKRKSKD